MAVPRLTNQEINPIPLIVWASVLIVAVLLGWLVIAYLRRRMLGDRDSATAGLFLEEMRSLRAQGLLSESEFAAARKAAVRAAERAPSPASGSASDEEPANPKAFPSKKKPAPHRTTAAPDGEHIAPPGFDLTGAPLPTPDKPDRPRP